MAYNYNYLECIRILQVYVGNVENKENSFYQAWGITEKMDSNIYSHTKYFKD